MPAVHVPEMSVPSNASLKKVVQEHLKIKDEPLLLAVHYTPPNPGRDIYLFEIAGRFGLETVDPDRKMFEIGYGSTTGFPLAPGQELRLLITNPTEWRTAVDQNWSAIQLLRKAINGNRARVLHATKEGAKLWEMIDG
jgi:hypothetical protein